MSNTATLERIVENVQAQELVAVGGSKLHAESVARAVAFCLSIFMASFTLGIFVCKAVIYSQMVHGIEIEGLVAATFVANAVLASLIMYCGKHGQIKQVVALGSLGGIVSGAVAYAVACVVFAA